MDAVLVRNIYNCFDHLKGKRLDQYGPCAIKETEGEKEKEALPFVRNNEKRDSRGFRKHPQGGRPQDLSGFSEFGSAFE